MKTKEVLFIDGPLDGKLLHLNDNARFLYVPGMGAPDIKYIIEGNKAYLTKNQEEEV